MKIGDLVRKRNGIDTRHEPWKSHGLLSTGLVLRIDKDFFGSGAAFKTYPTARGKAIRDRRVPDFIAKTAHGIRDRVLVLWPDEQWTYEESNDLEAINESR
jgi:hypothetical protein